MDAAELKRWMAAVARLTPAQKADLLKFLSARDDEAEVGQLVDSRLAQLPACPHCACTRIVRNGSASGLQRYKCRACQRTFNALSKTPLARLRMKGKWLQQEAVLARSLIIRRPKEKCLKREGKCVNPGFGARPQCQKARIDAACSQLRSKSVNRLTGPTSAKQICQRCCGCRIGSRASYLRPCNASA